MVIKETRRDCIVDVAILANSFNCHLIYCTIQCSLDPI